MNTEFRPEAVAMIERLGGRNLVRSVANAFLAHAPRCLADLKAAFDANDPGGAARAAHSLKSSAGQLGAVSLAALCHDAERLAEAGRLKEAASLLPGLEAEVRLAADHFGRLGAGAPPPVIAVVEDNPDSRLLLRAMLGSRFAVREFSAGTEALAEFGRTPPNAVLLDVSLPGMDGIELLDRIRADPVLRRIPVIAVTAHARDGGREALLARGFDGYVSKPILSETEVLDAVAAALGKAP